MAKTTESLAANLSFFTGAKNENVKHFFIQLKNIAEIEKWSEARKIVILKLKCKDKALNFIMDDINIKDETNFAKIEEAFIKKFCHAKSFNDIQNKFSTIYQQPGQSVQDLADLISELAEQYIGDNSENNPTLNSLSENIKLTKFIQALRSDLKFEVMKLGPKSFSQAIAQAKNIDLALSEHFSTKEVTNSLEINSLIQQQYEDKKLITELTEKVADLTNLITQKLIQPGTSNNGNVNSSVKFTNEDNGNNVNNTAISCHICAKSHYTQQCWYYPSHRDNFRKMRNNYRNRNGRFNQNYNSRGKRFSKHLN